MEKHKPVKKRHAKKTNHEAKKTKNKQTNIWQVSTAVLSVLLVLSVVSGGSVETGSMALTEQAAADKTVKFINQNFLQGKGTATLKSVEEYDALYNIKLDINGQEFNSFVTKDGKLLFPQVINLTETRDAPQQQAASGIPKTETPNVKLFTMSFCPYGNQAEDAMHPVAEALGDKAEIEPHYVIYSNYRDGGPQYCLDEENKYCSMYGIQELNQNVRELCVYKYQKDKYWDFVMKVNEKCSSNNVDSCWEAIAEEKGIDTGKIKACQSDEAIELLKEEVELNSKYDVRGSPVLIINGATYKGGRTPEAYKQAVCSAFTTAPGECGETLSATADSAPAGGCG